LFLYAQRFGKFLRSRLVLTHPDAPDDGRVLHLYRNRAELKKAYGDAQNELHRLKDRIKLQESATVAAQEQMSALEARLGAPVAGLNSLVFYQLRDLWATGCSPLRDLVRELSQQREETERLQFVSDHNRARADRVRTVRREQANAELVCADQRANLAATDKQLSLATGWWRYFQRRELLQRRQMMAIALHAANADQEAARNQVREIEEEIAAPFPGLTLEARRAINLAVIAYAHLLCVRVAHTGLVTRAGEAMVRPEPKADAYGDSAACLAVMNEIARAKALVRNSSGAASDVGRLTEQLRQAARYRSARDSVPADDSVRPALAMAGAKPEAVNWDVLRDDIWGITSVLL
jgi:hypothetical protein